MIPIPTGQKCGGGRCGYVFNNTQEEINSVMKFFNVDSLRARNILNELKLVYSRYKLDWDKTSEGICKLK